MEDSSQQDFDMTREFTCFLSNEYTHAIGSVKFNEAGIILSSSTGYENQLEQHCCFIVILRQVLEVDPFEYISSVNEVEPPNDHTLILSFNHRVSVIMHNNT